MLQNPTSILMAEVEAFGFHFLKDKRGWACYDADTRAEVPNSRHPRLGESVWLANRQLRVKEVP